MQFTIYATIHFNNVYGGYMNHQILNRLISEDGVTKKYLLLLKDGNTIESVLMKCKHGHTICISTQVGCRMRCSFCVTGQGKFVRNLTCAEMLWQLETIEEWENIKITCIVLMGMGEPLDNYDNVIEFLEQVVMRNNILEERIKLSTCGLCDKIHKLAEYEKK